MVSPGWFAHATIRASRSTPTLVGDHLSDDGPPGWAWQSILNDPDAGYADLTHSSATFRSDTIAVPMLGVPGVGPDLAVPWADITALHMAFVLSGPVGQRLVWDLFSNPGNWEVGGQVVLTDTAPTSYDIPIEPLNDNPFYDGAAATSPVHDLLHTDMPTTAGLGRNEVWLRLFTNAIPGEGTIRVHVAQVYWLADSLYVPQPPARLSGRMDFRLDTAHPASGPISFHPGAPGTYY